MLLKFYLKSFIDAVRIGELSGTETESFDRLAAQYQERSKAALGTLATLASIAILVTVMVLLAFMVIRMAMGLINGVYKPLFDDLKIPL